MKESIGENNLMNLKESLKIRKFIFFILIIYMFLRFMFYSQLNSIKTNQIQNIISFFDLTVGALFTALVYEVAKEHLEFTWTYENIYKDKIKKLYENRTKLKLLEELLSLANDRPTLLYHINDYYNYVISINLYNIYSREKFIDFIDKIIYKINSATTANKRNKLKNEIMKELNTLNDDAIKTAEFFLKEGKKLNNKYKI